MAGKQLRRVVVIVSPGTFTKSCRSCGASIVWGKTSNGQACPADATPLENGKYFSHFESCPHARQHSKKESNRAEQPKLV